jgi:allantoin racemase
VRRRIRVITPIITKGFSAAEDFQPSAGPETEISHSQIERGPASIEGEFDEALALPDILIKMIEAERDGIDAVVVNGFLDPGVRAGREAVSMLVLGPGEVSMHVAASLGHTFSVLTDNDRTPWVENRAKVFGLAGALASVRSVGIPVLQLKQDGQRLTDTLVEQSLRAVEEDGAHAIVFGCAGMIGCALGVQQGLAAHGYTGVPVIDPMPTAIKMAEMLIDLGLRHSKRTYPTPNEKRVAGYDLPARALPVKR